VGGLPCIIHLYEGRTDLDCFRWERQVVRCGLRSQEARVSCA
jgi:hypothetical protein